MGKLVRSILKRTGLLSKNGGAVVALDERVRYNSDGLACFHNVDFLQDPLFQKSYQAGVSTPHRFGKSLHIEWRVRVALWAAAIGRNLAGDFVECGVNSGILSRAIMEYLDFAQLTDKKFLLLDTFCGVPQGTISEDRRRRLNRMYPEDIYDEVAATFASFANVELIRGRIPGSLENVTCEKVCYLSIDLNVAEPEIAAGEFFWPRLSSGAVILLDDYGWTGHEEQKNCWDDFARSKNVPLLPLPTGQAILIKP